MNRAQFEEWLYDNCALLPGNTFEWAKALIERGMDAEERVIRVLPIAAVLTYYLLRGQ